MESSPAADPYAAIAAYYDLEHASFTDDTELYLSLAMATGDPVLELACGSGRLLKPLAEAGYRVTGIDQSAAMLARAAHRLDAAGLRDRVTLVEGSMLDADQAPGGPFGLVIIGLNGLLHLPSLAEQRAVLGAVRRALDPRGQLVIDVLNPTPDTLRAYDRGVLHEGNWQTPEGDKFDKFSAHALHPAAQQIETSVWYDRITRTGAVQRTATRFTFRYLHPAELELLLELAGFVEWQLYGSYELDPFDDESERLIVAAEVSPSAPHPAR